MHDPRSDLTTIIAIYARESVISPYPDEDEKPLPPLPEYSVSPTYSASPPPDYVKPSSQASSIASGRRRPSASPVQPISKPVTSSNGILEKLYWRERVRHYTWSFFTMTMATGGIANVLFSIPFRFRGLYAIGLIFSVLNIALFSLNIFMISLRFHYYPGSLRASFLHPTERVFVPTAVVSFGTILLNLSQYGPNNMAGHWISNAAAVLYWIDVALAFLASMGIYLIMWSTTPFKLSQMTPTWILPAYPLLIIGPNAGVLSLTVRPNQAYGIIVGGFTIQGIGFLVSLMIYSLFIYRLMTENLPQEATRPGMFVSVGPAGFTARAVITLADGAQQAMSDDFMGNGPLAKMILKVVASWMALWIWGIAMWFFFVCVLAHGSVIKRRTMTFDMTWFSYVFPNTALVTATFAIGKAFNSRAIQVIGCVMTPILILTWFFVFGMMIRAVYLKQILWMPKRNEEDDRDLKHLSKNLRTFTA